jgi:hypothetical protein
MSDPVVIAETLPEWVWCAVTDAAGLSRRVEDARLHYVIGEAAAAEGLPVDWRHVARRMADALDGREDEEPSHSEGS